MNIRIHFSDARPAREFLHEGRAGGSYTKKIKFEGSFVIVTDEWGKTWSFPAESVKEVETWPERW